MDLPAVMNAAIPSFSLHSLMTWVMEFPLSYRTEASYLSIEEGEVTRSVDEKSNWFGSVRHAMNESSS